ESFSAFVSANASENQGMNQTFDGLQRPIKTTQTATGAEQITDYINGNKTKVTSYNGDVTSTTYLAYGVPKTKHMVRIDSPQGVVTTQDYNIFGGVDSISQGGVTQNHYYNTRQQLCRVSRPDTGTTAYGKNTIGEIIWVATAASGSKTRCDASNVLTEEKTIYTHDNLGANKTVNYPDATSADLAYEYDNQGNLKTLTADTVVQSYNYFSSDMLKDETLSIDGKNLKVTYGYNTSHALTSLTYPDNTVVDFAPNGFGEPTKAAGYATNAKYYPDGQINSFTFGNKVKHVTTLNATKMPSSITATKDLESQSSFTVDEPDYTSAIGETWESASAGASSTTTTIMDYGYLYDDQGNITSQTDKLDGKYSITGMTYDGLERLTAANGYWGDVSIGYDTLGNITNYDFTNSAYTPQSKLEYAYNAENQLTSVTDGSGNEHSFEYDSRGNVTNNGRHTFDFNKAQQIMTAGSNTYVYDGHGRRVKRVSTDLGTTDYSLYSASGQLLYTEKGTEKVKYIFMGEQQVARIDAATQYIHTDLLGSPVVETNSSGVAIAGTRMHYRPFGATVETAKDEVGYTGHKFDTDIGLSYMQQRYYDPEIGRFYSNDPVGFIAKSPVMSFNRYMYVNNNPYKYIDPDGQLAEDTTGDKTADEQPQEEVENKDETENETPETEDQTADDEIKIEPTQDDANESEPLDVTPKCDDMGCFIELPEKNNNGQNKRRYIHEEPAPEGFFKDTFKRSMRSLYPLLKKDLKAQGGLGGLRG
ncbi:MAG: RHS repeat-associated core domain-containing protein, partial [Psychrosphaera sp.]|nr:RHS repeat-associated core domain-containing protein [Psychrosphaera sp.]